MSTEKRPEKTEKGHGRISFLGKVLLVYILCGFMPMILSIVFFYNSMKSLLLDDAYDTIRDQVNAVESNLEMMLQPYQLQMEMIKNDKTLQIELNANYAETSYVELADYADSTLDAFMSMYPELTGIHFYSANETLPRDDYYFYSLDSLDAGIREQLDQTAESTILYRDSSREDSFMLVTKMNSYTAGADGTCLEFELSDQLMDSLLSLDSETGAVLLDSTGTVLAVNGAELSGTDIRDTLPDWETLADHEVQTLTDSGGKDLICLSSDAGMNVKLLILKDQSELLRNVRSVPLRLISVLLVLLIITAGIILYMSRNMNRRLQKIHKGMQAIGSGHFDEKIEDLGRDEFGVMAREVNQMGSRLNQLIEENYQKQLTIKSSELNLLQEQINPHFLYNALAVISSLGMQERAQRTVQSIRYLADFYRISLNKGRKVITVREEIDLLNSYMKIQLLRFSDLVEIDYLVEPEVEEYYTIKLLLQPLVENAIHHAREEETFLSILVKAYEEHDRICFDVEDNGMGIPPEEVERLQKELQRQEEGFGLKNVDNRIKLAYGSEYGVTIFSVQGEGTRIHLEIPKVKER